MKKKINYNKESLKLHKKMNGKTFTGLKFPLKNKTDLSIAYTPGVAEPCRIIEKDPRQYRNLVSAGKTIAVISDGSAVLGLGNIGPKAGMPVMEGKAVLFKKFADLDAVPIVLDTQDTEEIIATIKNIAPSFGGINLEDFSAPRCFEIEERLKKELDIPVFHDDQHGTAIVVLAALINSLKIVKKEKKNIKVVINGVGAAGVAIGKLLRLYGVSDIVFVDSRGIVSVDRTDLNDTKKPLIKFAKKKISGKLIDALENADVFVGVSAPNLLGEKEIKAMAVDPIIFAMANPIPEIMPDIAKKYGVKIMATGRSDFPNQINNVLAFPGVFRGAIDGNKIKITDDMKVRAAEALAKMVKKPTVKKIIPGPFDKGVMEAVARAVKK